MSFSLESNIVLDALKCLPGKRLFSETPIIYYLVGNISCNPSPCPKLMLRVLTQISAVFSIPPQFRPLTDKVPDRPAGPFVTFCNFCFCYKSGQKKESKRVAKCRKKKKLQKNLSIWLNNPRGGTNNHKDYHARKCTHSFVKFRALAGERVYVQLWQMVLDPGERYAYFATFRAPHGQIIFDLAKGRDMFLHQAFCAAITSKPHTEQMIICRGRTYSRNRTSFCNFYALHR